MSEWSGTGTGAEEETPLAGIWLGGATASGKSAVALEVAQQVKGEIIAVDSMQVFRGMDIGTAKPSLADRNRVPHHLLDEVEVWETFNVATYLARARATIQGVLARGGTPVLCGGTGFYFKALLHGVGSGPEPDRDLRASLEATPLADLLDELSTGDPDTFAQIDRQNPRRVIRAVEVLRLSGKGASKQRAAWVDASRRHPCFFVLRRSPEDLRQRIELRVEHMFEEGLVEETQRLLADGLGSNPAALQAIGYRQVVDHLQGLRGLEATKVLVKQRTWQFARRQRNWFEHHLSTDALEVRQEEPPAETAGRLLAQLTQRARTPIPDAKRTR